MYVGCDFGEVYIVVTWGYGFKWGCYLGFPVFHFMLEVAKAQFHLRC